MLNTIIKLLAVSALITGLLYYWGIENKSEMVEQFINDSSKAADDFIGRVREE